MISTDFVAQNRNFLRVRPLVHDDQIVNGGLVQDLSAYDNEAIMTQLAPSDSEKVAYPLPGAVGPWAFELETAYLDLKPQPYFD